MVIASLALMFLNIYSASNTRELMFQAKYASVQDKIQVVASSFETADTLSTETVDQVISVLGDINVSRLLITASKSAYFPTAFWLMDESYSTFPSASVIRSRLTLISPRTEMT